MHAILLAVLLQASQTPSAAKPAPEAPKTKSAPIDCIADDPKGPAGNHEGAAYKAVTTKDANGKTMVNEVEVAGLSGEALWQGAIEGPLFKKRGALIFCAMQEAVGTHIRILASLQDDPKAFAKQALTSFILINRFEPVLAEVRRRGLIQWVSVYQPELPKTPAGGSGAAPDAGTK